MLSALPREILIALRLTAVVAIVTGILYPLAITGVAQTLFHSQANGSLITRNGQVIGSQLIGQNFTEAKYFQGRPSATTSITDPNKAEPYNAANSTGSNLGPSNKALIDRVAQQVKQIRKQDGLGADSKVPVDMVTTDFSGFDPNITEAAALVQVSRVAKARGMSDDAVRSLVEANVQGRALGIFGEPCVNVLALNLALDGKS